MTNNSVAEVEKKTPKNVLFFPVWNSAPHFETDLELMKLEINKGNNVYVITCNNNFKICDVKIDAKEKSCIDCIKLRNKAYALFGKSLKKITLDQYISVEFAIDNPEFNYLTDLKRLVYENYDIGYSIASSLAIDLDEKPFADCKKQISLLYQEAVLFFNIVKKIISEEKIDYGYIFNGRFCFSRAFFRAFEGYKKDVYAHERGANKEKYCIIKNFLPHSIQNYKKRVDELWDQENDINIKNKVANFFFESRIMGKNVDFVSFTSQQTKNKLPENFYTYQKKIVIFNSSSFEYDYVGDEYTYKCYSSQIDGIKKICMTLKNFSDIGIFLREHPNLKGRDNTQRKDVRAFSCTNYHLIPAESDISSYDLLLNADIVITFNSTMGIEATYWGKPSILCSNAIYEQLNITYMPNTHEEVINLILSDLRPIENTDAKKYGYFNSVFGINYKYYCPINFAEGIFMEKNLRDQNRLKSYLKKHLPPIIVEKIKVFKNFFSI